MADNKQQNKDAQSGEPVQLDKEGQQHPGGQPDKQHQGGGQQPQPGQQHQPGQQRPQQGGQQQSGQPKGNKAGGQEQGTKPEGGQRR